MSTTLANISNGVSVNVESIEESPLKVKLMEMGIIEGKTLKVLFRAPLGDPIAVDIDGYTLSLRKDEAKLVLVEKIVEQ